MSKVHVCHNEITFKIELVKMVLVGNIICIGVCVLETFAMNGLWLGWGQMTAIFKEYGLFINYCNRDESGTIIDCDERDILFNNIYTATGLLLSVFVFIIGILQVMVILSLILWL